jgi:hypothetical protein
LPSVVLTCANCGDEESEGARFCGSCGTPFEPDHTRLARDGLTDPSTTELSASPSDDALTDVTPPSPWPQRQDSESLADVAPPSVRSERSPSDPVEEGPASGTRSDRRVPLPVLIVVPVLLVLGGAVAALFGAGVFGGDSRKSQSAFIKQVNENVLGPLGRADETAAGNASTAAGAFTRVTDGSRIVRVADAASVYLGALNDLSVRQQGEVELLRAVVAANRGYGQAFATYAADNSESEPALDSAAAAMRAAIAAAEGRLPVSLNVPSQTAIITLRSTPTPPAPDSGGAYVRQVDGLLQESHAVVLALRSFIPRAASDAISRNAAVTLARSYVEQRRLELAQARALAAPPAFALAQHQLLRSLLASLADDEALVLWTVTRRDGSGDTRAAFARANRLGAQATALKQQFLQVYGPQRQAATGLSPGSLPDDF